LRSSQKDTDPRVKIILDYFYQAVKDVKGFSPELNGKDAKTVKNLLSKYPEDILKNMVAFFLDSKKADEIGITLASALSAHSLNLYQQTWQKKKWQYGDDPEPPTNQRWWT